MGFSSGTFTYTTSGLPVVTGTTISATVENAKNTETATGLTTCMLKDGTQTITANIPMANFIFTGLGAGTAAGHSVRWEQSAAGVMTTRADMLYASAANTLARIANGIEMFPVCTGRLTLTTAVPVTTADVTGATTVYFTPYKGNMVMLSDGTDWLPYIFSELSQATTDTTKSPAAVAASSNYDVFVWNDSGTLRATRGPAWTSDTARGTGAGTTELELFEGRYVNTVAITNGPAARRGLYVGTIRSNASSQINDSLALRHVWNNYNRVHRPMRVIEATDTWTYTTATVRQANANAANQLDFVVGLSEDAMSARAMGAWSNTSAISNMTGIGLDRTTANDAQLQGQNTNDANGLANSRAEYKGFPGIGRRFLAWLEYSQAVGTSTWYGDNGATGLIQTGIVGETLA